ncbi:MAG: redoxin domain-containing protein [Muribaculaceae bacterium]|nr:redoxin domain-containing protein [Muribaculaceae bacterium]
MNKALFALATVALVVVFTSARYTAPADARVGFQAPTLHLTGEQGEKSLAQYRGQWVLVTFWTSAEPQSRLLNIEHARAAESGNGFAHVGVNLDRSRGLFNLLVACDNVQGSAQWHVDAHEREQVMNLWRQSDERLTSLLIDPTGKVAAINPSASELKQL